MGIFDFVKVLFSKEARGTVGELFEALRRSPEWKRDLLESEWSIGRDDRVDVSLILDSGRRGLYDRDGRSAPTRSDS
jgi:hypothetical protein